MTMSGATCPRAWDARRSCPLAVAALLAGMALASGPDPTEPLSPALTSQPLSRALAAYARHTGIQVIYVSAVVRGQRSAALPAGLVPAEALMRLLEHSGLRFEFVNPRTVRIFAAPHDTGPPPTPPNGTDARGIPSADLRGGAAQHANPAMSAADAWRPSAASVLLAVPESAAWHSMAKGPEMSSGLLERLFSEYRGRPRPGASCCRRSISRSWRGASVTLWCQHAFQGRVA